MSVSVVAVNSTTLVVAWDPPLPEQQNGVVNSYLVSITERGLMESAFIVQETSTTISNLHPFYMYDITVAAITIGTGPKSIEFTITMPQSGKSPNLPDIQPVLIHTVLSQYLLDLLKLLREEHSGLTV